jgi:GNAT superfamily N-acetyltransferase
VDPAHRRRGLGRQLATPVFDVLEENDRGMVIVDAKDGVPWESKLEEIGMKKSLGDQKSRLLIEDVDWGLMDTWINRASERAMEYRLVGLNSPIPEEHLQQWCDVMLVMNTAPREDLEFEDFTMTPEKWRSIEMSDLQRGMQTNAKVAVYEPTGEWVGLSEITALRYQLDCAWQGDTGVAPAHRNKGLGRWLKAAMLKDFVIAHPEVSRIDTENAASNEAMLGINIEMGYRPLILNNAWQGKTDEVRERLGI